MCFNMAFLIIIWFVISLLQEIVNGNGFDDLY